MRILFVLIGCLLNSSLVFGAQELNAVVKPEEYSVTAPTRANDFPSKSYKIFLINASNIKSITNSPVDTGKYKVVAVQAIISLLSLEKNNFSFRLSFSDRVGPADYNPVKPTSFDLKAKVTTPTDMQIHGKFYYVGDKLVIETNPNEYFNLWNDDGDLILTIKKELPITIMID